MLEKSLYLLPGAIDEEVQVEAVSVDERDDLVEGVTHVRVRDEVGHVQVLHLVWYQVSAVQLLDVHLEPVWNWIF